MAITYTGDSGSSNLTTAIGTPGVDGEAVINGTNIYDSGLEIHGTRYLKVWAKDSVTVGSAGESMSVDISGASGQLVMSSEGKVYVKSGGTGNAVTTTIIEQAPAGIWFTGGTFNTVEQAAGRSYFSTSVDVPALVVSGGECTVEDHSSDLIDSMTLNAGTAIVRRGFNASSGTLTVKSNGRFYFDNKDVAPYDVDVSGYIQFNNGDIANNSTFHPGATLDFSKLEADLDLGAVTMWNNVKFVPPPAGISVTTTSLTLEGGGSFGPWS